MMYVSRVISNKSLEKGIDNFWISVRLTNALFFKYATKIEQRIECVCLRLDLRHIKM